MKLGLGYAVSGSSGVLMKYDDASWHYGADNFPKELPQSAGATHTGMFVSWAMLSGMAGELHTDESQDMIKGLQKRTITPSQFFLEACDGKFTDEDLNDEGNAFAAAYFDFENGSYLSDYEEALAAEVPTLYHVPDTWESYDRLRTVLDRRLAEWRARQTS
jgi:hypothetical protein